jgi:osmotically-inducible protein OsmY
MNKNDEKLKKQIVDLLYLDARVDASNVKVEVNDREVVLNGTVPTYAASEAALLDAWKPMGVVKVDNKLMVKYPSYMGLPPNDYEIKSRVESMLSWSQSIKEKDMKISVKQGVVNLEGYVDAYWKKRRATQIVGEVVGVIDIKNALKIVPTKSVVDEAIAEDIVSAIEKTNGINPSDLDLQVKNGKVTVAGTVSNPAAYHAALECIENTLGVVDIKESISIK